MTRLITSNGAIWLNMLHLSGLLRQAMTLTVGTKRLVKIGAEFSQTERGLSRWVISDA